jgi:hypothetical protein
LLSLFKINDPYKILIILFVGVIIQLPIFISGINITLPEIEWHTVGTKLAEGGELYIDVYYPIGPLSAQVYRFLSFVAPDGYLIYRILGLLLVIIQAVIFNIGLIQYKAYNQNTYVPSLIYVVLLMGMEDYITLSPQLMGLTFILYSINLTFRIIEGRKRADEDFIKIGLFSGFAALFYPLYIFFIIPVIIALIFFTNTIIRRFLLLFLGAFLPFFLTWLKFYWFNQLDEFYFNLDFLFLAGSSDALISWKGIFGIFLIPGLLLLYSFFRVMQSLGFINYQVRLQKYYFLYVVFGILIVFFDYHQSSHILTVFVPVMAFFIAHLFLMMRKTIIAEAVFIAFLSLIVFQNYNSSFSVIKGSEFLDYSSQYAGSNSSLSEGRGERILVMGNGTDRYFGNYLSTPYLSWVMLENQLEHLDNYNVVVRIFENFEKDLPETIIDERSVMPEILSRIPELSELYTKRGNQVYNLKTKNQ